ncbi:MAG: thioredoxin domain-containing protein [Planctomycetota bacterium]|nr:MAG: thioredoxin domain-containing protein [Planctomycetota bacterium]
MLLNGLLAVTPILAAVQDPTVSEPTASPTNHLAGETSPYLLAHVHNPVDWYPWGKEALERARLEDKPIFLSIGYSACHWCHVMERESFEDPEIAAFLNEWFISIKVDREERPDLDELYMNAVQRLTGSGGWPITVFLTPDLRPFYGGTYFPPRGRAGRPGFLELLHGIRQAWTERREEVEKAAAGLSEALAVELPIPATDLPSPEEFQRAERDLVAALASRFNERDGGFGPPPLFPRADDLRWLLAAADRSGAGEGRRMALHTLRRMALGGIHDQLGGGFARYSVDGRWLVPHFEKMLYDQGDLIPAYLAAWRRSGEPLFAEVARRTCDYLLREMRDPGGAFWSSTDADSEGEEGRFFTWTPAELLAALGNEQEAAFAARAYGVTEDGNFEHGRSILTRWADLTQEEEERLEGIRRRLYRARLDRVPPATDDKILTGWNGLVIGALAEAGRVLDEPRYTAAAAEAAEFLLRELRRDGRWLRSWRDGRAAPHRAVLEDHAWLCRGFLQLFQSTGEERWLTEAADLGERMLARFWNEDAAVFWNSDGDDPTVLHRQASPWDGATPSPNAVALECLALLHVFTRDPRWAEPARRGFAAIWPLALRSPSAFAATLRPLPLVLEEPSVAVVVGAGDASGLSAWRRALAAPGVPDFLTVFRATAAAEDSLELFAGRAAREGRPTLYLCRGTACEAPATDPAVFLARWKGTPKDVESGQ